MMNRHSAWVFVCALCPLLLAPLGASPVEGLWRRLAARSVGEEQKALYRFLEQRGTEGDWWRDGRLLLEAVAGPVRFTGYFRMELRGSLVPTPQMRVPVYALPTLPEDRCQPRAAIAAGALSGRVPVLFWTDDPVSLFFLHIQGSGRVRLDDGRCLALGWAGSNGQPYHPIGRDAVALGWLDRKALGMRALVRALHDHPGEAEAVMNRNSRYAFFRWEEGDQARGAMGLGLPPLHALAADPTVYPFGTVLVWELELPPGRSIPWEPIRRGWGVVMDEGAGVKGPERFDLFCGDGAAGEALASDLNLRGRVWLVRPGDGDRTQGLR